MLPPRFASAAWTVLLCTCLPALGKQGRLMKDINRSPGGVTPMTYWVKSVGSRVVFGAYSSAKGQEIWVAGPSGAAKLLKDIHLGALGSLYSLSPPTSDGKLVYFQADDGKHGVELWRSDGTTRGTRMIADLESGEKGSNPIPAHAANGRVFFHTLLENGNGAGILWACAKPGARPVQLNPAGHGGERNFLYSHHFASEGPLTYFIAGRNELWRTDGTAAGTKRLEVLPFEEGQGVDAMQVINGTILLRLRDFSTINIWASQGTQGSTRRLESAVGEHDGGAESAREFARLGDRVFFRLATVQGNHLWTSNGRDQGTRQIPLIEGDETFYADSEEFVEFRGALFFAAVGASSGRTIWRSDGTPGGTFRLKDLPSHITGTLKAAGKWLYLATNDDGSASTLWRTDGSSTGASELRTWDMAADAWALPAMAGAGNSLFFSTAWDTLEEGLWRTEGSPRSTMKITRLERATKGAFSLETWGEDIISPGGDFALFGATVREGATELWRSDGTGKGTYALWANPNPDSDIYMVGSLNGRALFLTHRVNEPADLWASDGSSSGTYLVKDFNPITEGGFPFNFVTANTNSYFILNNAGNLWRSDGTTAGTYPVKSPIGEKLVPEDQTIISLVGAVYFLAPHGDRKVSLWRASDASQEPTKVKEFDLSTGWAPVLMAKVGNRIAFFLRRESSFELWTSDGTSAGTRPVGAVEGHIEKNFDLNGIHLFTSSSSNGIRWYRSDGTAAGTFAYADAGPMDQGYAARSAVAGRYLFYSATPFFNSQLWKTDGTAAGTGPVREVHDGVSSYGVFDMAAVGDTLYFEAHDPQHGSELWRTDGTPAGTRLAADIIKGPASSRPASLRVIGDQLYFHAEGKGVGRELHVLKLP